MVAHDSAGRDTDVLIAGGGPAGLTLAISLAQRGIRCEVVDARPAPARAPGADWCGARGMEIFRRLGIASRLRAAGLPAEVPLDVGICSGSVARPVTRHRFPAVAEWLAAGREVNDGSMPLEAPLAVSQYTLEPLLREAAEAAPGVTIRFGTELVDFAEAGQGGVTAMVRTGMRLRTVRAAYLAGCDGTGSSVRQILRIELRGEARPPLRQALFYAPDLYERLPGSRAVRYHIAGEYPCTLGVQDDLLHFTLQAPAGGPPMPDLFEAVLYDIALAEAGPPGRPTPRAAPHALTRMTPDAAPRGGGAPIGYKLVSECERAQNLMLADRYGTGRVFLAGDAAHPGITAGALSMSATVADAADLAWKLAATLHGWGGPALLRSYEAERRPPAAQAITASHAAAEAERRWRAEWRPDILDDTTGGTGARLRFTEAAAAAERWSGDLPEIELGYVYAGSPVISPTEASPPPADSPPGSGGARYTPTSWPGARLPHIWLEDGTALHDRLGPGYTLLSLTGAGEAAGLGSADANAYAAELAAAFGRLRAPLDRCQVESPAAHAVYGGHRLILVRPDLHVAWRSGDSHPEPVLLATLVTGN